MAAIDDFRLWFCRPLDPLRNDGHAGFVFAMMAEGRTNDAEELLREAVADRSHEGAKEGCDDSILAGHVEKYLTEDTTFEGYSVDPIYWDNSGLSGTIQVRIEESKYRGCPDFSYQGCKTELIRFHIKDERLSRGNRSV